MAQDERRKELARLMLDKPNGLELIMKLYQDVFGRFPPAEMTPRQIIDAIVAREYEPSVAHHAT